MDERAELGSARCFLEPVVEARLGSYKAREPARAGSRGITRSRGGGHWGPEPRGRPPSGAGSPGRAGQGVREDGAASLPPALRCLSWRRRAAWKTARKSRPRASRSALRSYWPLERVDLRPRGGLAGGGGVLGRRRGRVEVGLGRREGGGEERVCGGERVVAEAEEVEEGLAVGEGDGRDAAEARGLDEVGVLEVVVLREEDGGGERVGAVGLLGGEGGGGVGREGVVGAEEDVVAGEDDLVQLVAGGVVAEHGEGIHRRRRRRSSPLGLGFFATLLFRLDGWIWLRGVGLDSRRRRRIACVRARSA